MKTKKRRSAKITVTTKAAIPAKGTEYTGAPIPATKVYARKMKEFRNCQATCLLAWNEKTDTVTFLNVYNDKLPASYHPESYTYKFNPKTHPKKMAQMEEIEVTDWPTFLVNAAGRRKASK